MARAIDKQTVLDLIIEAKRADPETGSFAEWLAEYLVEHLPTLTPQNEPLTIEELREMDGEPEDCWGKNCPHFHTVDMSIVDLLCACDILQKECDACDEDFCFLLCPLSKRPPEGEEDT